MKSFLQQTLLFPFQAMYEFFFLDPECYGLRLFSMFFIAFLGIFLFYLQLQIRGHGYKTGKWLTSKPFLYDMHKNMGRSFEDAVKAEAVVLLPGLALFTFVPSIVFSNFMVKLSFLITLTGIIDIYFFK